MLTFKYQMKQDRHPFVWLSPRQKKLEPYQLFLIWCIWSWLTWFSNTDNFVLVSAKLKCQIRFQEISGTTNVVIYHAATIAKSDKISSSIEFPLKNRMVLGLLKWLKNTFLWKKEKKSWRHNLPRKESYVKKKERVYEFLDKGKVQVTDFWG